MTEVRTQSSNRIRWAVISFALIAVIYLATVVWGLLSEANMVFGFLKPEQTGMERLLTAREEQGAGADSVPTPRQLSTVLAIAERVMALPDGADLQQQTRDVLVTSLNASSMTLREYRYVRGVVTATLRSKSGATLSDSLLADRITIILPRFQAVRTFFLEHRDSIGLAPAI